MAGEGAGETGVLLVPDSAGDRIMLFSPVDGSLIDADFITDPGTQGGIDVFNRPLNAIRVGNEILVSDQFADVVSAFALDGTFDRVYSLGGVRDSDELDNIRGIASLPDNSVLVANSGPTNPLRENQNSVRRLAPGTGIAMTDFAFNRYGGIRGPFDAILYNGDVLIADEGCNCINRYDADGNFIERWAEGLDFPQQMAVTPAGNLLVCVFSGGFIAEFDSAGTQIGQYDPGTLSLYRGIAELDNGNLFVTTTTGAYEVTRTGLVVETEFTGTELRYVERTTLPLAPRPVPDAPRLRHTGEIEPSREIIEAEIGGPRSAVAGPTPGGVDDSEGGGTPAPGQTLLIIEDSGFFGAPGVVQGRMGAIDPEDPSSITLLGNAGALGWGGIDDVGSGLVGFENSTNSIRNIDAADGNTLIDSVGWHEIGVGGFTLSNDGSLAYSSTNVGGFGRIVEADAADGSVLRVQNYLNRTFSALATVPDGTSLPYPAGEIWALDQGLGSLRLVRLDIATGTVLEDRPVTGIGFSQQFETGLDFAPDGTLFAAIQGFQQIGPDDFIEISSRLFTLNPATGAATLVGIIDADGTWDASTLVNLRDADCPADVNNDGSASPADFTAWLACFNDPMSAPFCDRADVNIDGAVSPADFTAWLAAFQKGCP